MAPESPRIQTLLAHGDPRLCATIGALLKPEGIECRIAGDGAEALRLMEAQPPQVAILDVAISGLYIFELVEKIKSRPALANTRLILLSSVYSKTAYKRTPGSLYGADDYIEKHHIPDDLVPKIFRLATGAVPTAERAESNEETVTGTALTESDGGGEEHRQEVNQQILQAENEELKASSEWTEKASRLAKIIATDIALYHQEKMDEGIRTNRTFDLMAAELEEGRHVFRQRMAGFSRQEDFVRNAFADLVERRRVELRG
ncbi:MAG: response regulator [Desulfuromonadales bacterium]